MKEYKTYKSSTIQTIELVANSLISFDIAKQNRENVIFSTELYKSRYRNPLTLTYHRNINNNDISAFGRGGYINVFYRLVKVDDTTLKVIYPNQEEEIFIYTDDKENVSRTEEENENIEKYNYYYYSTSTTRTIKEYKINNVVQDYELSLQNQKVIFNGGSSTSFLAVKIKINKSTLILNYINNNILASIVEQKDEKNNEIIYFNYTDGLCTSLVVKKCFIENQEVQISKIQLTYVSRELQEVKENYDNCTIYQKHKTFSFLENRTKFSVEDIYSPIVYSIYLGGEEEHRYVTKIEDNLNELEINYENNFKTTITTNQKADQYFFNENYDLLYVQTSDNSVKYFNYDITNKYNLLSTSDLLPINVSLSKTLISIGVHDYNFINQDVIDETCPAGNNCKEITFTNINNGKGMKIHYSLEGGKFDVLSLMLWCKVVDVKTENDLVINSKITFIKSGEIVDTIVKEELNTKIKNGQWYFGVATAQSKDNYDEVIVEITPSHLVGDVLNFNFSLHKKSMLTIYKYGEYGNVIKAYYGREKHSYCFNRSESQPITKGVIGASYNGRSNLLVDTLETRRNSAIDIEGNNIRNEIKNQDGNSIEEEHVYDNYEFLNKTIDENGDVHEFTYGDYKRLISQKTKDLSYNYGYITSNQVRYGLVNNLTIKQNDTTLLKNQYTYNIPYKLLTKINQNNQLIQIEYTYDELNRVQNIYYIVNSETFNIYHVEYDDNGNIFKEHYGNENYIYEYVYDSYGDKLQSVKINGTIYYRLSYEGEKLVSITPADGSIIYVKYGENDEVIQFGSTSKNTQINYDINGKYLGEQINYYPNHITMEHYDSSNIVKNSPIDMEYKLLSEDDDIYFSLMNERFNINKSGDLNYQDDDDKKAYAVDISPLLISKSKSIMQEYKYKVEDSYNYTYEKHGLRLLSPTNRSLIYSFEEDGLKDLYSIFFGFEINDTLQNMCFFGMYGESNNHFYGLSLNITSSSDGAEIRTSYDGRAVNILPFPIDNLRNQLHFMTLTFEKVNDLYNIYIYVDGQYVNVLSDVNFGEVQKVSFMGNTTGLTFRGKVTSIIINKNNYISEEKMNEYIDELTSIYNNNSEYPKMFQSSMALNDMEYDYFSLNKSLTSFKGVKPKTFISNNVIEKLEDNFEYDKDIDGIGYGRYVYAVKNQKLEYDLSLSKSGSIGFRYKAVKDEATILASLKDIASNFSVSILSLDDGALYFKIGGYTETTDPLLYEWNNVIVTWSRMVQSSSLDDLVYNLKIFVNGGLIINKEIIMNKEAENVILTIGDSLYNEVGSSKTYAYIEKLFYTKQGDIVGGNIHNILTYYPLKVNTYDNLYRMNESIIKTSANTVLKKTYDYKKREKVVGEEDSQVTLELETNQILGEVFFINDALEYASNVSYDDYGRVVKIRKYVLKEGEESPNIGQIGSGILILDKYDVTETNYEYDSLGQLKSTNQNGNETFSYDSYGNLITVVKDGVLTKSIGYEGIKLKTYNGKSYEYEGLYITKEKEGEEVIKEYKWEGNKLVEVIDHKNKKKYKYIYSVLGLRTSKTIYSIEDEEEKIIEQSVYNYNSKQLLVSEARVFVKDGLYSAEFIINYMYDAKDEMYGFSYNGVEYYFERDIQGNIARIYNNHGTVNAVYKYDAFGEHMVYTKGGSILNSESFIGNINRIRYKGYYYDKETQLYWVSSRYYSPELCRWILPDSIEYLDPQSINGLNLYAYCGNDPINKYDPTGHFGIWALVAITAASMLIGGTAQLVSNAMAGKTGSELWRGVAGATVGAGINALALCLAMPTGGASLFIAAGASAIAQTGVDTLETVIRGEEVDVGQTFIDLGLNFVTTLAGNYLGSKMVPTNRGWFQTKNFWHVFTMPYGQKILLQTAIGAGLSGTVNFIRKNDWSKYKPIIPMPVLPLYPLF